MYTHVTSRVQALTFPPPRDTGLRPSERAGAQEAGITDYHGLQVLPCLSSQRQLVLLLEDRKSHIAVLTSVEPESDMVSHSAPVGEMASPTCPESTASPPSEGFALALL